MRNRKRALIHPLITILFILGAALGALILDLHLEASRDASVILPTAAALPPHARILIVAPHPDDETLGAGGIIREAVLKGAEVRVVLMTNGDAFRLAALRRYREISPSHQDYINFAYIRQAEALRAVRILGLSPSHVTFLGYPDRGLARLWLKFWTPNRLYRSPYTGCDHSPYRNSFQPRAPYCGASVLSDLRRVIAEFRPDEIYTAHPNDEHPDHWATYCFVRAALEELRAEQRPGADKVQLFTFLIHRGDWPVPQGLREKMPLTPPKALAGTGISWRALPLSQETTRLKQEAVLAHGTQIAVMRRFLLSFVRSNELIGIPPRTLLPSVPANTLRVDGYTEDWRGIRRIITDPVSDKLTRLLQGSADISGVYAARSGDDLFLRMVSRRNLSSRVRYCLRIHRVTEPGKAISGDIQEISIRPAGSSRGRVRDFAWRENELEVRIPASALANACGLMLSADARIGGLTRERTGWQFVALPGNAPRSEHLASRR